MTAIHLIGIDPEKNMARFYKLDVQPNLFGHWSLARMGAHRPCRHGQS
jgi:hypothetical protein